MVERTTAERDHRGFRAVGVAVSKLVLPIIARRRSGAILARLKAEWTTIAGPAWAEVSWPTTLGRDGALKLRTTPSAALELQHTAPLVIERINLFFGRPIISRLVLVQGPLPLPSGSRRPVLRELSEREAGALDQTLSDIVDPDLRAALARLGRAVNGATQQ